MLELEETYNQILSLTQSVLCSTAFHLTLHSQTQKKQNSRV
jgi:urease accessory protein UreF